MARGRFALAAHAQGSHIPTHGRDCGCPHHFTPGMARRLSQLGLSILLGARRVAYFALAARCRLSRRSEAVAGMALARRGWQPFGAQYRLWPAWRAQA